MSPRHSFLLCAFLLARSAPAAADCALHAAPVRSPLGGGEQLLVFEEGWNPDLLAAAPGRSPALARFRQRVAAQLDTEPHTLLRAQRDRFVAAFGAAAGRAYEQILSGELGQIRGMTCLEELLLEHHLARLPEVTAPAEFQAIVLERAGRVRIYLLSATALTPPPLTHIGPRVSRDVTDGWRYLTHVHNHPFYLDNPAGDPAGTLIPSGTVHGIGDLSVYRDQHRRLGLEQAWITNGFHSLRLAPPEFARFAVARP